MERMEYMEKSLRISESEDRENEGMSVARPSRAGRPQAAGRPERRAGQKDEKGGGEFLSG